MTAAMNDVVIPAYYEDPEVLAGVVDAVRGSALAGRVIVVENVRSKGAAMAVGLQHVTTERMAFFDADLVGLTPDAVDLMLSPQEGMVIGAIKAPSLFSGQRCLPTAIAARANLAGSGYGAEIKLAKTALAAGVPIRFVELPGVHHLTTEEKGKGLAVHVNRWADVALGLVTP